jgi:hypothetical protein
MIASMRTLVLLLFVSAAFSPLVGARAAADETWAGRIADSACGAHHEEAAEGSGTMSDHDCTIACVRGGSKYVLVSGGRVLSIQNQQFPGLADYAGQDVTVTGSLADGVVIVSRIERGR